MPDAYIKVVTDGILLAETQGDPWLNEYDTIIVDEAHERSLNIDFVLGILKRLVQRRHNLTLVITSATIDTEKFSKAFDDAPVIEVSGRLFPGGNPLFYSRSPMIRDEERGIGTFRWNWPTQAIDQLSGRKAIAGRCAGLHAHRAGYPRDLRDPGGARISAIPLFCRYSPGSARRSRKGSLPRRGMRKIIVATNVAETSITIPGIKYVVDTGLARISQYVPRSRTTSLAGGAHLAQQRRPA